MENKIENNTEKVKISKIGEAFIEPSKEELSQIEEIEKSPAASPEQKKALIDALNHVDKDIVLETTGGKAFEKSKNSKNIRDEVEVKGTSKDLSVDNKTIQQVNSKQIEQESDKEIG